MTRSAYIVSRRRFLRTTSVAAAGATLLARTPAALGQQVRELNVWHTEVEPQTVKTIQDTSIAEFEKKFPGFKVKQQALGWGDLNTKLLASLAAGSPPDLTHLNPFMTASLYVKNLLRPMDELIRALGENDIHETLEYVQKLNKFQAGGWSGQKYLDTLAALSTGKIAMAGLSGARTIGYIEKYAPENLRSPEAFMPLLRPHGPSGKVGISALDGENWAAFTQSKYPNEAFEFLRLFYKKEHYLQYCHSVPIHLTPIFKSMINDPAYLANERIKKWKPWHDVMVTGLRDKRFLPIGFSRPEDNVLPFLAELDGSGIVADMVVEVMVGGKNPKAEADRAQRRGEELPGQLNFKRWS